MSSLLIVLVLILEKCNYLYCLVGKNRDNYAKKKHPFCTALLLEKTKEILVKNTLLCRMLALGATI